MASLVQQIAVRVPGIHLGSVQFTLQQISRAYATISSCAWGQIDGCEAHKFTLKNSSGLSVTLTDYGATLLSVKIPQGGESKELTLNYWNAPTVTAWQKLDAPFYGVVAGRFANRISKGQFTLDGTTFQLPAINNGPNHLHGGKKGFDKFVWKHQTKRNNDGSVSVRFERTSPHNEEGYPGNLEAAVTYTLNHDNQLTMAYEAKTDLPTPINLTNHTYWNLGGVDGANPPGVLDHMLQLKCSRVLPVDDVQIPTGELRDVAGSGFDFRSPKRIGKDIMTIDGGGEPGYDHCFVIDHDDGNGATAFATVTFDGVTMKVSTTQPGVQLYTGNFLGKGEKPHRQHMAFCLETQHFPDSPNKPSFPSCILRPGEQYFEETTHTFAWE